MAGSVLDAHRLEECGDASATRALPVWESGGDLTQATIADISNGLRHWHLWGRLGWQDVALRYRRSVLGPFWLTLSMGVMVGALGLVYGTILKADMQQYLPFLTVGFLVWAFISTSISEGCQTFIEAEWIIRQIDLPLSMFPLRVVWRNLLVLVHNFVIYFGVIIFFDVNPGWSVLAALPGLMLLVLNGLWCSILLGMLSARFRDLPQVVSTLLQVAFFVTPIVWMPALASDRPVVVGANPFYHFLELVRAPLLGSLPSLTNCQVALAITVVGWLVTILFYRRFHGRIAYWV